MRRADKAVDWLFWKVVELLRTGIFNFNQEIREQGCEEPTLEEIKSQINILKNNKSPEEDNIQSELLKKGRVKMALWLWKIIHKSGLRQGNAMSPNSSNIVVEKIIREELNSRNRP